MTLKFEEGQMTKKSLNFIFIFVERKSRSNWAYHWRKL